MEEVSEQSEEKSKSSSLNSKGNSADESSFGEAIEVIVTDTTNEKTEQSITKEPHEEVAESK